MRAIVRLAQTQFEIEINSSQPPEEEVEVEDEELQTHDLSGPAFTVIQGAQVGGRGRVPSRAHRLGGGAGYLPGRTGQGAGQGTFQGAQVRGRGRVPSRAHRSGGGAGYLPGHTGPWVGQGTFQGTQTWRGGAGLGVDAILEAERGTPPLVLVV